MFTHLHVHTEYSLLDGLAKIDRLVQRAVDLGMDSLAITDHGAMYGVIEFYETCKKAGIKPIIGVEAYVAKHGHRNKSTAEREYSHLILLCKDQVGYKNLIKLTSIAFTDGFYYKPRIDRELLEQYHEGLVCLSACASGEVAREILDGNLEQARENARWYKNLFGDDYYIELQEHGIKEHDPITPALLEIARELDIKTVATADCHYVEHADHEAHDLLLCIQSGSNIYDEKRWRLGSDDFYLKSEAEMRALWGEHQEAIDNTAEVAAKCNLELEFGRVHLPQIDNIPNGMTPDDFLSNLCWLGLEQRYGEGLTQVHRDRLTMELDVIRQTGFANYFLVVWDFVAFARQRDILFGVRGSAAGSIVLYCLGITDIDPIVYGLVFERFLNIERKEMPDIDMDFADDRRDEMIRYVTEKYGADHVAQIITFGTLGAKAALRDVGRALAMPLNEVNRVAAMIPTAPNMNFERAFKESADLTKAYKEDPQVRRLVDAARPLEGMARHASTHAAGVVISRDPIAEHAPVQRVARAGDDTEGGRMVQFDMVNAAKIGLLKMDFLGLINLTILDRARTMIARRHGVQLDLANLPLDDAKTYELLAAGQTVGVFQLEGTGMRRYIKELKPNKFTDIAAMVALYRPGPMEQIPRFIDSKHGKIPITYPHEALRPILEETYGVIVYQDQVLFIAREFAGYSLGQADIFRKAMGKKIAEVMAQQRQQFISGAIKQGYDEELAVKVFELIEPFAGYAFNKAHSVCYAMLAYQTAYLKANYPAEYMAALLTQYSSVEEKVQSAVAECQRLGLQVLPPDINHSRVEFSIEQTEQGDAIRCGFIVIKNVGAAAMTDLVAERDANGPFTSIEDLCRRADPKAINKRTLESLIKVGALDSLGQRSTLLANLDRIVALAQQAQKLKESGQTSMFDLLGASVPVPLPSLNLERSSDESRDLYLQWEKELLGLYLSDHPFARYAKNAVNDATAFCGQIGEDMAGQSVIVAAMVASTRVLTTKAGKPWAAIMLEDLDGSIEAVVWSRTYEQTRELWTDGSVVLVRAKVEQRDDRLQLVVDDAKAYVPTVPCTDLVEDEEPHPDMPLAARPVEYEEPPLHQVSWPSTGYSNGNGNGLATAGVMLAASTNGACTRMVINVDPHGDRSTELRLMEQLFSEIRASGRGHDSVQLIVRRAERVHAFEVPDVHIHDDLCQKLASLLGASAIQYAAAS